MKENGRLTVLYIVFCLSIIISCTKGQTGPKGEKGEKDFRGEKGEKGVMGDEGEKGVAGIYAKKVDSHRTEKEKPVGILFGSEVSPAASCADIDTTELSGSNYYISPSHNPSKKFKVTCVENIVTESDDSETKETILCLEDNIIHKEFHRKPTNFTEKEFWLSTKEENVLKFYNLEISQLTHLLRLHDRVNLEIVVHCKNTEINKSPEKSLQILLWNDHLIGPTVSPNSPIHYEIIEDNCKVSTEKKEWGNATIRFEGLPTFFKDFYIRDIRRGEEQGIFITLKKLCFNDFKVTEDYD